MLRVAVALLALAAASHPFTALGAAIQGGRTPITVRDASCPATARHCPAGSLEHGPLAPGGPPAQAAHLISYQGTSVAIAVRLYIQNYESRGSSSLPVCSAPDPARSFAVVIRSGPFLIYSGSLADLASIASSPGSALYVPAADGRTRWRPGDSAVVTTAVGLARDADNSYMGCSSHAELAWLVSR